jgi:hypothetical protein
MFVYRTNKYLQKSSITRVCAVGGFFISIPVFLTGKLIRRLTVHNWEGGSRVTTKKRRKTIVRVEVLYVAKLDCHRVKGSWITAVSVCMQITMKQVEVWFEMPEFKVIERTGMDLLSQRMESIVASLDYTIEISRLETCSYLGS